MFYKKYKAITKKLLKRHPRRRLRFMRDIKRKEVLRQVYRFGFASTIDWGHQLQGILTSLLPQSGAKRLHASAKLKRDYVDLAIQDGGSVYSYPYVDNPETKERARKSSTPSDAWAVLKDAASGQNVYFQVLGKAIGRKKVIRTQSSVNMKSMSIPATVQYFTVARNEPSGQDTLMHSGGIEVKDLLFMEEWSILRSSLRKCQLSERCDAGTLQLNGSSVVSDSDWDIRHGPVPSVVLLDRLAAEGWQAGKIDEHTLSTERVIRTPLGDPVAAKPYLQCLLCIEDILMDSFPRLSAGQCMAYYECVLSSSNPSALPLDKPPKLYRCLLSGGTLEEATNLVAIQDTTSLPALLDVRRVQKPQKRPVAKAARPSVQAVTHDDALWMPLSKAARVRSSIVHPPSTEPSSSSSSAPP